MYNTQFKVKYHDIEEELIQRFNDKTRIINEDDYNYTLEDIYDICSKLYRDELLTVFGVEDLIDDKINTCLKYINEKMITHNDFNGILDDMFQNYIKQIFENTELNKEKEEGIRLLILISLFSQPIFYITHKCICQYFETGLIDNELLSEFKKKSIEMMKN